MSQTVTVNHPVVRSARKENIERDLYWYDTRKKKMLTFKGGSLDFEYKLDNTLNPPEMRMLPKIASVEVNVSATKTDDKAVSNWFEKYLNYNHSGAESLGVFAGEVQFEVPDDEVEHFLYDLERNGLRGEV